MVERNPEKQILVDQPEKSSETYGQYDADNSDIISAVENLRKYQKIIRKHKNSKSNSSKNSSSTMNTNYSMKTIKVQLTISQMLY